TLAGHLFSVADLLDKLDKPPASVPADVRNRLRTTVASLSGLLKDVTTFVVSFHESLKLIDELTLRFDWTPQLKAVSVFVPEGDGGRPAKLGIPVEAHAKSRVRLHRDDDRHVRAAHELPDRADQGHGGLPAASLQPRRV